MWMKMKKMIDTMKAESDKMVRRTINRRCKKINEGHLVKIAVLGGEASQSTILSSNKYCNTKKYIDATQEQIASWKSMSRNNVEAHTCRSGDLERQRWLFLS